MARQHHFWDMDHTIIDQDCDVSWKSFMIAKGLAAPVDRQVAEGFFRDYQAGFLNEKAFLHFQLREFRGRPPREMEVLAEEHFQSLVKATVRSDAFERIQAQIREGHQVYLLTATNRIVAMPVARYFGISQVLATELELRAGCYTGQILGRYCAGEGKLARLRHYCRSKSINLAEIHYYGDSVSDIEVLQKVGHPVAVNPQPGLRSRAQAEGWPVVEFGAAPGAVN
jgi:HAD superfamily hydrolase (TIGR01490 family)